MRFWSSPVSSSRPCCSITAHNSRLSCRQAAQPLESVGVSQEQIQDFVNELSPSRLVGVAGSLLGGLAGVLSDIFFLIVLLFFTVVDAGDFASKLKRVPVHGQRLAEVFDRFAVGSRQYLAVATVFGAIVAFCDFIALWILDIRYAWLWALLAFITNYIPNIGFIIGLVPPTIIALLDKDVVTAIIVVVVYCVLNFVIQTIIQPRVVGVTVGLSATLSFLSLIVWATILGASGAFLAIPLSLLVKALLVDVDPEQTWVGPLLSSEKPGDVSERLKARNLTPSSRLRNPLPRGRERQAAREFRAAPPGERPRDVSARQVSGTSSVGGSSACSWR